MSLTTLLRQETAALHAEIESLPIAIAMAAGRVERRPYTRLLQGLLPVHQALEGACARQPQIPLAQPGSSRVAALRRDLAYLGATPRRGPWPALARAMDVWGEAYPAALIGAVYVLDGSRMGSAFLAPRLAQALGVPATLGVGLDYHLADAEGFPRAWKRYKQQLDALGLDDSACEAVVEGARATFRGMIDLYAAVPVGATVAEPKPVEA